MQGGLLTGGQGVQEERHRYPGHRAHRGRRRSARRRRYLFIYL